MKRKATTPARGTCDADRSSHSFGNLLGDTQPQASPMNLQGVFDFAAVERFKDMGQVFRLNSNAVILNRDSDLRPLLAHSFFSPDTDPAFFMAVLDGIGNEVLYAPAKG